MASLQASLCVSGTVLHRDGAPPLLAVAATQDGHLVQASVIDTAVHELTVDMLRPRGAGA